MNTVEEILEKKNIEYRQSGRDLLIRCINPEHDDRHPSLRVDKTTGVFNCFSCGFKGNLFQHFEEKPNWLQIRRQKLSDTISAKLIETAGIKLPEGRIPFTKDWRNISKETFIRFEAFEHNDYPGRVIFPIRDISGKPVALCGRHTGMGTPKYMFYPNEAKIPLFPVVKPIQGSIILVEGIFDMLNLHDKGLPNAVAAFGVNKVTKERLNILKIQGVTNIDIFMDNDTAGQEGAEKLIKLLDTNEMSHRNITITGVKDPGELTASKVIKLKEKLYSG